ncbi:MAG: hypothetical protein ACRC5R_02735, partial [Mycoplasmatales bacterium]
LGYTTRISFESFNRNKSKQKIVFQKLKKDDKIIALDFSSGNQFDSLFDENVIFITNFGRYIKLPSADIEEYQIQRMGKRIAILRKNEVFQTVMFLNNDLLMFTDLSGYVRLNNDSVANVEKLTELYSNIKSNPHTPIKYMKLNSFEILMIRENGEEVIKVSNFKNSEVSERIKVYNKDKSTITLENIVNINE